MEKDSHFLDTISIVPWNTYLMFVNLKGNFLVKVAFCLITNEIWDCDMKTAPDSQVSDVWLNGHKNPPNFVELEVINSL